MATYEYECKACDLKQVETFSISLELPIPNCPNCKQPMQRIFGVGALRFKGTGWGKDSN